MSWLCAALFILWVVPPALADATNEPQTTPVAQAPLEDPDGPIFPVSQFVLVYSDSLPDQPQLDGVLPMEVTLGRLESGFVNARPGVPTETVVLGRSSEARRFHASAIGSIGRQLLPVFHEQDLVGVYVTPHTDDIEVSTETDLRMPHDTVLRMVIHLGRISELRTIGSGDRLKEGHVDHQIHRSIRTRSPIQPTGTGISGTTDLLRRDELEDYIYRLNRHPGRHVEAALGAASNGEGVALDYRVIESKPWLLYYQSSNTGTDQTGVWQHRVGFSHRQLTNRDDILSVEYLNAGRDRVHGISASYEAPWFQKRRPAWLRNTEPVPDALSWLPRDHLPWFGSDRLRWQAHGYWNKFVAKDIGVTDDFEGDGWGVGGRFLYNVWQHRALFVDLMAGFKVRNVEVNNTAAAALGQEFFMIPEVGLNIERLNQYSAITAKMNWEHNVGSTREDTLRFLGRPNPDGDYHLLRWNVGLTHYLEPLLRPGDWKDPNSPLTSTLAHEISLGTRGQYSFDYRLIPQVSQVVGGLYSVRGYPASIGTGDTVYVGSLEYRFHLPQALPIREKPVRLPVLGDFRAAPQQVYGRADWDLILRTFIDAGRTIRNKKSLSLLPEPDQTLVGAGVGLELRLGRYVRARADWATALKNTSSSTRDVKRGHDEFHFLFSVLY